EVDVELDAVHALTAHNAKGLEFPVVFMVQLVEDRFPGRPRTDGLPLPDELAREAPVHGDALEQEERRLFYVGMTRAREELVLTHAFDYGGKMKRKMSRFVAEALRINPAPAGTERRDPRPALHGPAPPTPAP